MRVLATVGFATATIVSAGSAGAQSAVPVVRPLVPIATSDTLTLPDARDVAALTPLRLGLLSSAVPHPFATPGCEPAGHATGLLSLPNQNVAANGLRLGRDLRLTFFGFARDGCAFDQAVGTGLAMTFPIRKDVYFMWGGGAIYLPANGPGALPRREAEIRAGIVWTRPDGRSYSVGISGKNGGPNVSFSGVF